MKYVTLSDLSITIRRNFYKIPHDIDFIVTIPRSGTIVGSIISEFLNCPMIDIYSFIDGAKPNGGGRLRYFKEQEHENGKKKVLVVDDTVFTGKSKKEAREQLKPFEDTHDFIFLVAYLEGPAVDTVDIYLEDVRYATNGYKDPVIYEWNIFHHNESTMETCMYDIDGVLCIDPPDERNGEEYIEYIKNAIPLFTPTAKIGALVTYRLVKNEEITKKWLSDHGIRYGKLIMFNAQTWDERNAKGISPELMKGEYYKSQEWAKLFVESDDYQAQIIHKISGKPVYCVASNRMYAN